MPSFFMEFRAIPDFAETASALTAALAAAPPAPAAGITRRDNAPTKRLLSTIVLLLGLAVMLVLPFVLQAASSFFLPILAAVVIGVILSPLADALCRIGLPNAVSSALSVLALILVMCGAVLLILQPALNLADKMPEISTAIGARAAELRGLVSSVSDFSRQIGKMSGQPKVREVVLAQPSLVETAALATPAIVLEVLITLLLSFFVLESRIRVRKSVLLDRTTVGGTLRAARAMKGVYENLSHYVRTVALINLAVGVLVCLATWALGLDVPVMWGGLAALLNFIPYLGPMVMVTLLTLVGLGAGGSIWQGLAPVLSYLVLHLVESNVVTPAVLGNRLQVSPIAILISISYFSWVWGVVGTVLSVPLLIIFSVLLDHLGRPNIIGFALGEPLFEQPALPNEPAKAAL